LPFEEICVMTNRSYGDTRNARFHGEAWRYRIER
jgi:hypothetical protein